MDVFDLELLQRKADKGSAIDQFNYGIPIDISVAAHYSKLAADSGPAAVHFS
jgi:hypothetical protein